MPFAQLSVGRASSRSTRTARGPHAHASSCRHVDRAPETSRQELLRAASAHDLVEVEILQDVGEPIKTIYLPASGIISLLAVSKEGLSVEAGLVGREGFAGISALLGRE